MRSRYAIQAVLVYVAIGIALGMVGWAVLIHDSGSDQAAAPAPTSKGSQR
jgi:hypothetical protein